LQPFIEPPFIGLLLLQQISSEPPASVAVFVDPSERSGIGLPNARIPPVSPVLSGRDQAFTNTLIKTP
jgi:hypothetical protein